jgi:hypothetical protein
MGEIPSAEGDIMPAAAATVALAGESIMVCEEGVCRSFDVVVRISGSLQAR